MKTFIWRNNLFRDIFSFFMLKVLLILNLILDIKVHLRRSLKKILCQFQCQQTVLARATLRRVSPQFEDDSPITGALPSTSQRKIDNALYQTRCNNANACEWRNWLNHEAESIATMPSRTFRLAISFRDIPLHWLMHPYFGHQSCAMNTLCNMSASKRHFTFFSSFFSSASRATKREEMKRRNFFHPLIKSRRLK